MTDNRSKFRPEPIPAAIPASERGYFAVAPEPTGRASSGCGCTETATGPGQPRTILLTRRDARSLAMWVHQLAETPDVPRQGHPAATPRTRPTTESTDLPQAWWRPRGPSPPQRPGPA